MTRVGENLVTALLIALSLPIALHAFGFQLGISGSPEFHVRFAGMPLLAACHVLGSGVALLVGGFQFVPAIRERRIVWHRSLGRVYLLAVLVGGIGGLALAQIADGGPVGRIGFAMLGVLWLASGWKAWRAVRRGDIAAHRLWMIRSFALTFAAVTLRLYLGMLTGLAGLPFEDAYPVVAWLSWVPNLVVAEWWLADRGGRRTGELSTLR